MKKYWKWRCQRCCRLVRFLIGETPDRCPRCFSIRLIRELPSHEVKLKTVAHGVGNSAIEEIADTNDVRQNVGLRTGSRGKGGSRSFFGSRTPMWKRQLAGVRAAAAVALKRKKEAT